MCWILEWELRPCSWSRELRRVYQVSVNYFLLGPNGKWPRLLRADTGCSGQGKKQGRSSKGSEAEVKDFSFHEHKLVASQSKYCSARWLKWPLMQVAQQLPEPDETSKRGEPAQNSFWGAAKPFTVMEQNQQRFLRRAKFIQVAWGTWGHELQGKKYQWGNTPMPGKEARKDSGHGWWITTVKEGSLPSADQ